MTRFIFSFFGGIFAVVTMGTMMIALTIGAIFWMYGRDLPSHEHLAQYTPPTISRIYSQEGRVIDEFAQERRLFTPANEIPDLVKNAFISAEDKNFYTHQGYDVRGIAGKDEAPRRVVAGEHRLERVGLQRSLDGEAAEREADLVKHGIDEGVALAGAHAGRGDIGAGQQAAGDGFGHRFFGFAE